MGAVYARATKMIQDAGFFDEDDADDKDLGRDFFPESRGQSLEELQMAVDIADRQLQNLKERLAQAQMDDIGDVRIEPAASVSNIPKDVCSSTVASALLSAADKEIEKKYLESRAVSEVVYDDEGSSVVPIKWIFVVSDSTGSTATRTVRALLQQFGMGEPNVTHHFWEKGRNNVSLIFHYQIIDLLRHWGHQNNWRCAYASFLKSFVN